jgi:2-dehydropantoate 2-reductase
MKIAIVGPGAIGCLLGGLLSRAGHEVWLIDRRPERAALLDRRGVSISGVGGDFNAAVRATASPTEAGIAELIIVAVKSYDTAAAAQAAQSLVGAQTTVLTVQNGLGNVEALQSQLGADRVVAGVTSLGATRLGPGQVQHAGRGPTVIGELDGRVTDRLKETAGALSSTGLEVETTTDVVSALWGKLAVNAGINAVATLARLRNGGVVQSESLLGLLRSAVREVEAVAGAKRIELPEPDMAAQAEEVCRRTADNTNSMLQDVRQRRRTEVEAINGAVVREGAAVGVATPVNAVLVALIHGLEETYQNQETD